MKDLLKSYIPVEALSYCQELFQHYPFHFQVTRPRRTKFGDFRVFPDGQVRITVNADLNPYAFLITFIHEVAHLVVHRTYRRRPQPHGKAWQTAFQKLMQPLLTEQVFPAAVLYPLQAYMLRPAATTSGSPALVQALRQYDSQLQSDPVSNQVSLKDLSEGQSFVFRKKIYVRGALRRTRVVCKEVDSGVSYAILAHAWVDRCE
ncbi:SprT-like domain-containing protein [Nibrella saemangeumensis]|uniref:SprT-like domain-containing protein n=1 Tax=Nibrella saemangeumensis TaxID=1084526 RepID=A0ABP8NA66_9BACT